MSPLLVGTRRWRWHAFSSSVCRWLPWHSRWNFCSLIPPPCRYRRGHNLLEQIKDAKLHAGDWKLSHPPARREDPVAALEKEVLAARKGKGAAALR